MYINALTCAFVLHGCNTMRGVQLEKDIFSFKANIGQNVPQCPHAAGSSCACSRVAPMSEHWESYNPGIHESLMSSLDHAPRIVWRPCLPSCYSWLMRYLCSLVFFYFFFWIPVTDCNDSSIKWPFMVQGLECARWGHVFLKHSIRRLDSNFRWRRGLVWKTPAKS